ncbi:MAG: hypothetical protein ACPLZH_03300, partial [Minisyncoccales bacterium]
SWVQIPPPPPKNMSYKKLIFVDGFKIRNFVDNDFGIIESHSDSVSSFAPTFYIPKNEIWLDYRYQDESDFLLKILNFRAPKEIASEANWREFLKRKFCSKKPPPAFKIKKEKKNNFSLIFVDGGVVRRYFDPEFILGGHDLVYSYIPQGEIWLDIKMDPLEIPFTLLHEKKERELMKKGKSYDIAHEFATIYDKEERRGKLGVSYPGDKNYIWYNKSNKEIRKELIVKK